MNYPFNSLRNSPALCRKHSVDSIHLNAIFHQTLSLGVDLDNRGLQWKLSRNLSPEQRLAFALAVYFTGGLYVLIDAERGFLCVERIVQHLARLKMARLSGAYLTGHAFCNLYEALGYGNDDTVGFALIERADVAQPEAFIKGFGDALEQSLEADVLRLTKGRRAGEHETLLRNLRHYIDDHETVATVLSDII